MSNESTTTEATGFSATELRAEVEAVNASRGTIISFEYRTNSDYDDQPAVVVTHVAISDGKNWGVTEPNGGGSYVSRVYGHQAFIAFLASKEVVSATTLVQGEAFKP